MKSSAGWSWRACSWSRHSLVGSNVKRMLCLLTPVPSGVSTIADTVVRGTPRKKIMSRQSLSHVMWFRGKENWHRRYLVEDSKGAELAMERWSCIAHCREELTVVFKYGLCLSFSILSPSQDKSHCQLSITVCTCTTCQWASFNSTTDSFSWGYDPYTLAWKARPSFDWCGTFLTVSLSLSFSKLTTHDFERPSSQRTKWAVQVTWW